MLIQKWCIPIVVVSIGIGACDHKPKTLTEPDQKVLAKVNGAPVMADELDRMLVQTLGEFQSSQIDEEGRRKALQSLIVGRAMAQAAEQKLSVDEKKDLDLSVGTYREKLLVNRYLKDHTRPQPVTDEMVKTYYEQHKELFGGTTIRRFEMVFTAEKLQPTARKNVLAVLKSLASQDTWEQRVKKLNQKGYALQYRQGDVNQALLQGELKRVVATLRKGEASKVTLVEGRPYLLRVTDERALNPRPIQEVSSQIRKSLLPIQLKKAVKEASDELMKTAVVEYVKDEK